jgi:hypothetical protein
MALKIGAKATRARNLSATVLACAILVPGVASCGNGTGGGGGGASGGSTNLAEIEDDLQQAIIAIEEQPASWQTVLSNTTSQLTSLSTTLTKQVQDLVTNTVGQAQSATQCELAYFGDRVVSNLQQILHDIDSNKPAPNLVPVVCDTTPSTVITAGTDKYVTYFGYDFNTFAAESPFEATLKYSNDGAVVTSNFGHVDVVSPFEVEVEFQSADLTALDPSRGPELQLTWEGGNVSTYKTAASNLPIIVPVKPKLGSVTVRIQEHAPPGLVAQNCQKFDDVRTISAGVDGKTMIDQSHGDPGTPGIHLDSTQTHDNAQEGITIRGYNARVVNNTQVEISWTMCGAGFDGPGADFDQTYDIYTIDPGS